MSLAVEAARSSLVRPHRALPRRWLGHAHAVEQPRTSSAPACGELLDAHLPHERSEYGDATREPLARVVGVEGVVEVRGHTGQFTRVAHGHEPGLRRHRRPLKHTRRSACTVSALPGASRPHVPTPTFKRLGGHRAEGSRRLAPNEAERRGASCVGGPAAVALDAGESKRQRA